MVQRVLCSGLLFVTVVSICSASQACGSSFEDLDGTDVTSSTISGNSDAALDSACCSVCEAHSQCTFWVRESGNTGSKKCWLKKSARGRAYAKPSRRGGYLPVKYLGSDIPWDSCGTLHGPCQIDNHYKTYTRGKIEIYGQTFNKGVVTYANSMAIFAIDGKYSWFHTCIGISQYDLIEDCGIRAGEARFRVLGDGRVLKDWITMGSENAKCLSVSILGIKRLYLVTSRVNPRYQYSKRAAGCDRSTWADAFVQRAATYRPSSGEVFHQAPPNAKYLGSDIPWDSCTGRYSFEVNCLTFADYHRFTRSKIGLINGEMFSKGFATSVVSKSTFTIDGEYSRLYTCIDVSSCGGRPCAGTPCAARFRVLGDGSVLKDWKELGSSGFAECFSMSIPGVNVLVLQTDHLDNQRAGLCASSKWADAFVQKAGVEWSRPSLGEGVVRDGVESYRSSVGEVVHQAQSQYLGSDIPWDSCTTGYGSCLIDKDYKRFTRGKIDINGQIFSKGFVTHAASKATFTIDGKYSRFHTCIGISQYDLLPKCGVQSGDARFRVLGDSLVLQDWIAMGSPENAKCFSVSIAGVNVLVLETDFHGIQSTGCDRSTWADAFVYNEAPTTTTMSAFATSTSTSTERIPSTAGDHGEASSNDDHNDDYNDSDETVTTTSANFLPLLSGTASFKIGVMVVVVTGVSMILSAL